MAQRKKIALAVTATILFLAMPAFTGTVIASGGASRSTVITVTIVKIDLTTSTIAVKDSSGRIHAWVVDPQTVDLTKLKVGQVLQGTIEEIASSTTGNVGRAVKFKAGDKLAKAVEK